MNDSVKKRIEDAQDRVLERLEYIMETYPTADFVEIVGNVSGDIVTYRVYDDGSMYEK